MYVRTKDWIYDTENLHYRWIENNKVYKVGWDVEKPTFEADIIDQSENLEELCDEFVIEWLPTNHKDIFTIDKYSKEVIKSCIGNNKTNVYGAIWVDGKGLIYVAKMNSEGKLVLI